MLRYTLTFLLLPLLANAVVRCVDTPDSEYIKVAKEKRFEAVGIVRNGINFGTGFLISPKVVLTAGHVVYNQNRVQFAIPNKNSRNFNYINGSVILHENFFMEDNGPDHQLIISNDIALVVLDTPIPYTPPLRLCSKEDLFGFEILCCGFGRNGSGVTGQSLFDYKKRTFTGIIENYAPLAGTDEYFISYFYPPDTLHHRTPLEGAGSSGDSGSPVVIERGDRLYVIGILTLVSNEGRYGALTGILPLYHHERWIEEKVQGVLNSSPYGKGQFKLFKNF